MKRKAKLISVLIGLNVFASAHALEIGSPAPNCTLKSLSKNAPIDIAQYKGKVTYIDFWASWCGPCNESMPFLDGLQSELKSQGLEVVAINVDENSKDAETFLAEHPVNLTIAVDAEGKCPGIYGVKAMPSSYLIDRQGKVRHIQLGFHNSERDDIREKVKSLLVEK